MMGGKQSAGFVPLLGTFLAIGYDALHHIDPVQGGADVDVRTVRYALDGRIAVIGGLNAPVTLERGTRDEIRQQVFEAVKILGPGGV